MGGREERHRAVPWHCARVLGSGRAGLWHCWVCLSALCSLQMEVLNKRANLISRFQMVCWKEGYFTGPCSNILQLWECCELPDERWESAILEQHTGAGQEQKYGPWKNWSNFYSKQCYAHVPLSANTECGQDRWVLPEVRLPKLKQTWRPGLAVLGALRWSHALVVQPLSAVKVLQLGTQASLSLSINFICEHDENFLRRTWHLLNTWVSGDP